MRPQFHFTAGGWINDPHGVTFANRRYHSFFQYVPNQTAWSLKCSWGHASGEDLFSLQEEPVILAPGDGDDGIWSGSLAISDDGTPRIFYTAVSEKSPGLGKVRTATPTSDDWSTWVKGPEVIREVPPLVDHFRDPIIVREDSGWRMLVGAGLHDGSAAAVGYFSEDLMHWKETGTVLARPGSEREPVWSGSMWECPQLIEVDGQFALVVSVWDEDVLYDVVYALGSYTDGVFSARKWGRLSHGNSLYAATAFRDQDGHACLLFWLRGITGHGWAGAHSIPYRVSIIDDELSLSPHPDIDRYHRPAGPSGYSADVLWPAAAANSAQFLSGGRVVLKLERNETELLVRDKTQQHSIPWSEELRIIIDGPILEISSRAGVFAMAIQPLDGEWELAGSGIFRRDLRRAT